MPYVIGCSVSGGVTGHNESRMKKDGKVRVFAERDEALKVMPTSRTTNKGVHFRYWLEFVPCQLDERDDPTIGAGPRTRMKRLENLR